MHKKSIELIYFIGDTIGFQNGVSVIVKNVEQELAKQHSKVSVFSPFYSDLNSLSLPFYPGLRLLTDTKVFDKLEQHLKKSRGRRNAIIITSFAGPLSLAAIFYCDKHNIAYNLLYTTNVAEIAQNRLLIPKRWSAKVTKFTLKNAARVLTHSKKQVAELTRLGIANIKHWPCGVNKNLFRRPKKGELNPYAHFPWYRNNPLPILISTTRLDPDKDLKDFPWDYPSTHKVILSDGPERHSLERFIKRHKLPNIHFLGRVSQPKLAALVRWADVMPFPSRFETWGSSALEAVASGTPLVARNSGGPTEFVTHGVHGVFMPENRPLSEGIAEAIRLDREYCSKSIHAQYSWKTATKRLLELVVPNTASFVQPPGRVDNDIN